jgi:hypothetical protein
MRVQQREEFLWQDHHRTHQGLVTDASFARSVATRRTLGSLEPPADAACIRLEPSTMRGLGVIRAERVRR